MLKLIGAFTVVYILIQFGIIQLIAIWGMAVLAMIASI
jgi:hypothetical protein